MNVLVTGGTGALGRQVVTGLRASGHRARVLSRKPGTGDDWVVGNLATGTGIDQAVTGMDAIVHAGSATVQPWRYHATDVVGTRRLLDAAKKAGIGHVLYISIVGMEGIDYAYFKHKLAAEAIFREDIVPWTILRATQFHTLTERVLGLMATLPGLATVPYSWQFQLCDAEDVAMRLVDIVASQPLGMLPNYGGPKVQDFKTIAEAWLRARRSRRRLLNLTIPLQFSRKFSEGAMLCPDHRDGTITWEKYLESRYGP